MLILLQSKVFLFSRIVSYCHCTCTMETQMFHTNCAGIKQIVDSSSDLAEDVRLHPTHTVLDGAFNIINRTLKSIVKCENNK